MARLTAAEVLGRKVEAGALSEEEAEIIREYISERQSTRGIQDDTARTKAHNLGYVAAHLHSIGSTVDRVTTASALEAVVLVRQSDAKQNYKKALIGEFKALLLWMIEGGYADLNPVKIQKITVPAMNWRTKTAADLLTKEMVLELIGACENSRDRAFVSMLYDGSNRPIELRKLKWGDITFDKHGARFRTSQKTGIERWIRLTFSVPTLAAWKNDYPEKITPEAHVFVTLRKYQDPDGRRHRPLTASATDYLANRLTKKTGINFHAYLMRHARISHDLEDGYDQTYIMLKNWGHLKASMLAVYGNPRIEILERDALEKAGMADAGERRQREKPIQPRQCPACHEINDPTHQCCKECGYPLTEEAMEERNQYSAMASQIAQQLPPEVLEEIVTRAVIRIQQGEGGQL